MGAAFISGLVGTFGDDLLRKEQRMHQEKLDRAKANSDMFSVIMKEAAARNDTKLMAAALEGLQITASETGKVGVGALFGRKGKQQADPTQAAIDKITGLLKSYGGPTAAQQVQDGQPAAPKATAPPAHSSVSPAATEAPATSRGPSMPIGSDIGPMPRLQQAGQSATPPTREVAPLSPWASAEQVEQRKYEMEEASKRSLLRGELTDAMAALENAKTPPERAAVAGVYGITLPLSPDQVNAVKPNIAPALATLPENLQQVAHGMLDTYTALGKPDEGAKEALKMAADYQKNQLKFGEQQALEIAKEDYGIKKMGMLFAQQMKVLETKLEHKPSKPLPAGIRKSLTEAQSAAKLADRISTILTQDHPGGFWEAVKVRGYRHIYKAGLVGQVPKPYKDLFSLSDQLRVMTNSAILSGGPRSMQFVQMISQHLPDADVDTPESMMQKLTLFMPTLTNFTDTLSGGQSIEGEETTRVPSKVSEVPGTQFVAPQDAPPAPSEDGHTLKANGKTIAVSKGGKWTAPGIQ